MNEEQKKAYHEKYNQAKQTGEKFYPDVVYKDLIVSFAIFLLLVGMAAFVGVAIEPKADPTDAAYIPRPEWYFLWLFEMLKYFPGQIEWVGTVVIPVLLVSVLFLLPFLDRNPHRHFSKRRLANAIMTVGVIGIVAFTLMAVAATPPQEETDIANTIPEKIVAGEEQYAFYCAECHGPDGEGGEIVGVEGLEGVVVKSISSQDEMYTRSDDTLYNVIDYGQPDLGMPPFGTGYGGELGPAEMENIVVFMRYTWDDRTEIPEGATVGLAIPPLGPDEVPSYEAHLAPIIKRYCVSCHRPGKKNNDYLMQTYEETMQSGDNAPNIIPGDLDSNMMLMLHRQEIDAGGPMPPSKPLPDQYIEIFERWILNGAPNTAEEAAALSPSGPGSEEPLEAIPEETATPTP